MFGFELMSPFMVGYLNDKDVSRKKHSTNASTSNRKIKKSVNAFEYKNSPANSKDDSKICSIENINFTTDEETNFSDSKSLHIQDNNTAFSH